MRDVSAYPKKGPTLTPSSPSVDVQGSVRAWPALTSSTTELGHWSALYQCGFRPVVGNSPEPTDTERLETNSKKGIEWEVKKLSMSECMQL